MATGGETHAHLVPLRAESVAGQRTSSWGTSLSYQNQIKTVVQLDEASSADTLEYLNSDGGRIALKDASVAVHEQFTRLLSSGSV